MKENAKRRMKAEMEKTGVTLEQKAMYVCWQAGSIMPTASLQKLHHWLTKYNEFLPVHEMTGKLEVNHIS